MFDKIFEIYNGNTKFWQWDTKQKLIVLDDSITEVRFTSKNSNKAKRRIVYTSRDGDLVCDVPDSVLQNPSTLTIAGCVVDFEGAFTTIGSNRFAVIKQSKPEEYMCEDPSTANDILTKLAILGAQIQNIEEQSKIKKFESNSQAEQWARENNAAGSVIVIHDGNEWIVHAVNDDFSVSPVCNNEDEMITVNFDGGGAFGVLQQ